MYRPKKAENLLRKTWKSFQKNHHSLPSDVKQKFEVSLHDLKEALLTKDKARAVIATKELDALAKVYLKRSYFVSLKDFSLSLFVALCIAIVIRQSSFELYEIPSGSMRPTYKEKDRLVVSKTQFGLNIPLTTSHLLFNPEAVKRMGVITFTGENMDIPNVKTNYFYLFPGYKQYIKRVIGLPGDTLYFYGGKIYGIDKNGKDISNELQRSELSYIEHLPFIHIEGKVATDPNTNFAQDSLSSITIKQMNIPLAKLYTSSSKDVHYDLLLHDKPAAFDLYDLFGMKNFASVRILPKEALQKSSLPSADYYLEVTHHASLLKAKIARDFYFRVRPMLHTEKSYLPLSEAHLKAIWSHIYTGRFIVENNHIRRYGLPSSDAKKSPYLPKIKGTKIPDGTYEFYNGSLYKVNSQGVITKLPKDHPLALFTPAKTLLIFNTGIECDTRFDPSIRESAIPPSRYAYFRDGDLYLMGAPILLKEDPALQKFLLTEIEKQNASSRYLPFIDLGPPLNPDGSLNIDLIKTYGVHVPEKHYLALGDNHAMSADSRDFGFVPEDNIRGIPSFLFWAPGDRYGFPNHGIYPLVTPPRLISWTLLIASYILYRKRSRKTLENLFAS